VQKTNFETVVANAARRAGVAALIPRGRQGLAGRGHKQWWGWPTSATQHERHAEELVASLLKRQEKLEALVGRAFQRRYVAGSSAGAYFVSALALHGDIEAAGFGAMSGGARAFGAKPEALSPVPFYIGYGKWDPVGAAAEGLATVLRAAKWPVHVRKHPLPHGAREVYLDEAFSFWRAPQAKP
jgi:predicted esterase